MYDLGTYINMSNKFSIQKYIQLNKFAGIFCLVGSGSRAAHLKMSHPDPAQNRSHPSTLGVNTYHCTDTE
jgi:hypothetical protein